MTVPDAPLDAGRDALQRYLEYRTYVEVDPLEGARAVLEAALPVYLQAASEEIECPECTRPDWRPRPYLRNGHYYMGCASCGGSGRLHVLRGAE